MILITSICDENINSIKINNSSIQKNYYRYMDGSAGYWVIIKFYEDYSEPINIVMETQYESSMNNVKFNNIPVSLNKITVIKEDGIY